MTRVGQMVSWIRTRSTSNDRRVALGNFLRQSWSPYAAGTCRSITLAERVSCWCSAARRTASRAGTKPESAPQSWHTATARVPKWITSIACGWQESALMACRWSRRWAADVVHVAISVTLIDCRWSTARAPPSTVWRSQSTVRSRRLRNGSSSRRRRQRSRMPSRGLSGERPTAYYTQVVTDYS